MIPTFCVFTGSRAEYGLMRGLLTRLRTDPSCKLELIVSGAHLSEAHGNTQREIIEDGFESRFQIKLTDAASMAEHSAEVIQGCCRAFQAFSPDVLIVLGDRYESFAAASAAYLSGIPIAHLHGGETTQGALDDALRHAITLMATWHFTAAYTYLDVVRKFGAEPNRSFCIGPMVLDALQAEKLIDRDQFEVATGFKFAPINLLVTYHSVTKSPCLGLEGFEALLQVLDEALAREDDINILFTYPNLDQGGYKIIELILAFVETHQLRCWALPSLGQTLYLSALRLFSAMIGNSSSGIIEAPLVGLPVLNIGDRQKGRLRYGDVVDADPCIESIQLALEKVIYKPNTFPRTSQLLPCCDNIFPQGPCPSDVIVDKLLTDARLRSSINE